MSSLRVASLGVALALAACATTGPAPVEERSSGDAAPAPPREHGPSAVAEPAGAPTYRVEKGDTLYAIAFKRGIDFRELAAWNHIPSPYRIFVGQELRLRAPPGYVASAAVAAAVPERGGSSGAEPIGVTAGSGNASAAPPSSAGASTSALAHPSKPQPSMFEDVPPAAPAPDTSAATSSSAAAATGVTPASSAATPAVAAAKPAESVKPTAAPAVKPPAESASKPPVAATNASAPEASAKPVEAAPAAAAGANRTVAELNAGGVRWRWPGEGKVVGTFVAGDQTRQGVDIAGKAGDPVLAAADGEVVYSGNGLLGYGELIIIKHNASFLSAYGHNRARLVKEGDKVKGGQQIAEMGSSASARDELHFEIRKNGKPVNPLEFLPVR